MDIKASSRDSQGLGGLEAGDSPRAPAQRRVEEGRGDRGTHINELWGYVESAGNRAGEARGIVAPPLQSSMIVFALTTWWKGIQRSPCPASSSLSSPHTLD